MRRVKAPPPSGLASAAPFGEFRELRTYLRMELHIYLRSSDGRAAEKQVLRLPFAALRVAPDEQDTRGGGSSLFGKKAKGRVNNLAG